MGTEVIETDQRPAILDLGFPAIADTNILTVAEEAEKRLEALKKIKNVALRATNAKDWVDQNGKPYLQASGAEKVARVFGISWRIQEPQIENLEAGHFMVTYMGEFALGGAIITAVGTRSSNDQFFTDRYEGSGEARHKVKLPASEIDKGDVKKSAYTNLLANGITRILGLRNLTYADLEEYAKITKEAVTKVEYRTHGKPPAPAKAPAAPIESDGLATEAQVKAIHAILNEKFGMTDEYSKHDKAKRILGLEKVPTSMSQLTRSQASRVIDALQNEVVSE